MHTLNGLLIITFLVSFGLFIIGLLIAMGTMGRFIDTALDGNPQIHIDLFPSTLLHRTTHYCYQLFHCHGSPSDKQPPFDQIDLTTIARPIDSLVSGAVMINYYLCCLSGTGAAMLYALDLLFSLFRHLQAVVL